MKEEKLLIKGGRVIDPANNIDAVMDILVEGSVISKVAKDIKASGYTVIDAADKIVIPGLVDMHVHLREPGREDKETIQSGTLAALKGGVTSVLAMPNTSPAIDCPEHAGILNDRIKRTAAAHVYVAAAITKGRLGKELVDIPALKKCGAIAFTDDGSGVDSEELLSQALGQAEKESALIISHCEDKALSSKGLVNLGLISTRLGLRGISGESEYKRVERDIQLAGKAKARIHIAHVSCKESVEAIAKAKKQGIAVTAETCPHYFALTEEEVLGYDANMKMNPPLRCARDREAILQGLKDGTIEVISSDHAPHTENEKDVEFEYAEFGVVGLQTALAAAVTELIESKLLGWDELVRHMSLNPARILGINKGSLSVGSHADITVISPQKTWVVEQEDLVSKSKNSAFLHRRLKGVVEYTVCCGKIAYKNTPTP